MDEGGRWVTMTQAGEQASLDLESVTQWAAERLARLEAQVQRRQAKQLCRELGGRPDLEHDWLDVTRALLVGHALEEGVDLAWADRAGLSAVVALTGNEDLASWPEAARQPTRPGSLAEGEEP